MILTTMCRHSRVPLVCSIGCSACACLASCALPAKNFDDYEARTANQRGVTPEPAPGTPFSGAATELQGTWFTSCYPKALNDPEKTVLFYVEVKAASPSTLDMTYILLRKDATTLDRSQTGGALKTITGVPIRADDTFDALLGRVEIDSTTARGGPLVMDNVVVHSRVLAVDKTCGEIDGQVIQPIYVDFTTPGDFCVSVKLPMGAALPKIYQDRNIVGFPQSWYHCP